MVSIYYSNYNLKGRVELGVADRKLQLLIMVSIIKIQRDVLSLEIHVVVLICFCFHC